MNPHTAPSWRGVPLVEEWPFEAVEFFSSDRNRRAELERVGLFPANKLHDTLKRKLYSTPIAEPNRWPASVQLEDGSTLPRVVFVYEDYVLKWHIGFWLAFVRPKNVVDIRPSPFTIPVQIARELAAVGETSMSSLEFRVKLTDGSLVPCWYSSYNDFIELPGKHSSAEIEEVEIDRGLVSREEAVLEDPDFVWCIFR